MRSRKTHWSSTDKTGEVKGISEVTRVCTQSCWPFSQGGQQCVTIFLVSRNVNDHKCSSIIKLRYRTDSISKRNENVQNSLSSDRKKNRNIYRGYFSFINKTKRNEVYIFWFLGPCIKQGKDIFNFKIFHYRNEMKTFKIGSGLIDLRIETFTKEMFLLLIKANEQSVYFF